ncbi:serine hydrolase domain-containing protein [Paenibacillus sp. 481]|uniref:serine hydrolase domain-containing protein n=1 Tax=Paenibacillus sp. 481 TaxID=2835869 RepID=UPI002FC28BFE
MGLIIENITSQPYHEVLHDYIFALLRMNQSFLSQYSNPAIQSDYPTAHLYMDDLKIKIDDYRSFSSFYAGGQTVCTSEDLLIFMKALVNKQLVRNDILDIMHQWNNMWIGVDYGYGLMRMRFLPFARKYIGWGHLGASGSFMLYVPNMDVYLMGSFNQTAYQAKSMNVIFWNVLRKLAKCAERSNDFL